jgi:3-oxoacyl-(acyl-carrier-protein) synthase
MAVKIRGMGWVTPLGVGLDEVWQRVMNGGRAEVKEIARPERAGGVSPAERGHVAPDTLRYIPVPPKLVEAIGRNPRLRRSSAISLFSAAAGLAALENAGIKMTPELADRTAVVFAIASGGVVYTRKFYEQIVRQGANAASPLLFPETVYNAPASHLAALLGITGMSYTLVGDASVGIAALKFGEQILETSDIDQCVVVGGEEVDWVLCEAYREWRLARTPLAEGAAALVLAREGAVTLRAVHDGVPFFSQRGAAGAIEKVHADLARHGAVDLVVSCANGTFVDRAETASLVRFFPDAKIIRPKQSLGEALGAGALMQTIFAALAVQKDEAHAALVSVLGFNQQASGAVLS